MYILLPEGFFSRGSSVNPVCKLQPIDAVVELGWDQQEANEFQFYWITEQRKGKGTPCSVKGKKRNKLRINTQIRDYKTCGRSQQCDVPDYDVLADGAATLWMGIVSVSDGLKRGNKPIPGLTAATRLFNR